MNKTEHYTIILGHLEDCISLKFRIETDVLYINLLIGSRALWAVKLTEFHCS